MRTNLRREIDVMSSIMIVLYLLYKVYYFE